MKQKQSVLLVSTLRPNIWNNIVFSFSVIAIVDFRVEEMWIINIYRRKNNSRGNNVRQYFFESIIIAWYWMSMGFCFIKTKCFQANIEFSDIIIRQTYTHSLTHRSMFITFFSPIKSFYFKCIPFSFRIRGPDERFV